MLKNWDCILFFPNFMSAHCFRVWMCQSETVSQESHNPELFISLPQTYDYPQFRLFSSVQNSKNGDIFSNHYELFFILPWTYRYPQFPSNCFQVGWKNKKIKQKNDSTHIWLFMKDINNLLRNRFELILNLIENWNWIIYEFNVSKFENRLFLLQLLRIQYIWQQHIVET